MMVNQIQFSRSISAAPILASLFLFLLLNFLGFKQPQSSTVFID